MRKKKKDIFPNNFKLVTDAPICAKTCKVNDFPRIVQNSTKFVIFVNMNKIRTAIVGYGNIGRYALQALQAAPDMECAGIVRRNPSKEGCPELENYPVVSDIRELGKVDVAILATPSRKVEETAVKYLEMGINTVDSFDIHTGIWDLRCALDPVAKENGAACIISAGWDPGTDSIVRTLLEGMIPQGITYTNFGPGRSMGHSVAAKAIEGVKDALGLECKAYETGIKF